MLLTFATLLAGCSKDDDGDTSKPNDNRGDNNPPAIVMEKGYLTGTVKNAKNEPLAGVKASTGTATVTTDANGHFRLENINVIDDRYIISFSKSGFHTISRSGRKSQSNTIDVVMMEQGNNDFSCNAQFDATKGINLSVGGMQVAIQPDGLQKADGSSFSGSANANMLYLSPDNKDFPSIMPGGDMAAIRNDNSDAILVSYGMVEVSLTDASGNKLQLKEGKEAELTFPIPESKSSNPPATIPLWYFNEGTGLWVEEGVATLRNGVYVGKVSHFSWHNLDVPEERVTLHGTVTDCQNRPVAGVKVLVDQVYEYTDAEGKYSIFIPSSTPVTVVVASDSYFGYLPEVSHKVEGQRGGSTYTQDIKLPCLPVISGQVANSCDANALVFASVYLEYTVNGKKHTTTPVWTNAKGKFQMRFPIQATFVKLLIETVGGKKMEKGFARESGTTDINAGIFEICESIEGESLRLLYPDGTVATIPFQWDSEKTTISAADGELVIMNPSGDGIIMITLEDYGNMESSHWTGTITVSASPATSATTGNIEAELIETNNHIMRIAITGSGKNVGLIVGDTTGSEEKAISISGTISIPRMVSGKVTSWDAIGFLPSDVPALTTPIDDADQVCTDGLVITNLRYASYTEAEIAALKTTLTNASFSLVKTESREDGTGATYAYATKETLLAITENSEEEFPLEILICKNSNGVVGNNENNDTEEKCWEYTYTIMGEELTDSQWGTESDMKTAISLLEGNGFQIKSYQATNKTEDECGN